jgi:glycosyltransferase involved in cell wall biosynthesis
MPALLEDIVVITPLYNEAHHLHSLIDSLNNAGLKKIIFGVSPNSSDDTKLILSQTKIPFAEPQKDGYDFAVEAALEKIDSFYPETKLVLFAEAHQKYNSEVLNKFLKQIDNGADLVMGIRRDKEGDKEWFEKIGTKLIIFPLQIFFRRKIRDISPFRLVRRDLIKRFALEPKKFRWPTEMIVKSLAMNLNIIEISINLPEFDHQNRPDLAETIKKNAEALSALQFINYKPAD